MQMKKKGPPGVGLGGGCELCPILTGSSLMAWEGGQSPLMKSVDGRKLEDAVDASWFGDTKLSGDPAAEGSRKADSYAAPSELTEGSTKKKRLCF